MLFGTKDKFVTITTEDGIELSYDGELVADTPIFVTDEVSTMVVRKVQHATCVLFVPAGVSAPVSALASEPTSDRGHLAAGSKAASRNAVLQGPSQRGTGSRSDRSSSQKTRPLP